MATDTTRVLNLNLKYSTSVQGILKIIQLVFLLVAYLIIEICWYNVVQDVFMFFKVITLGFFFAILLFFILSILGLPSKLPHISWSVTEFILDTMALLCVFPVSCAVAVKSHDVNVLVAASMLGLVVSLLFTASIALSVKPIHAKMQPHISAEV